MRKSMKFALALAACGMLTGCPKATSVTGRVLIGVGALGSAAISVGDTLTAGDTYYVDPGASITVTYDNGKTCTFTGPTEFVPGNDGSVCEKKDNNDKKQDDKKKDKDDQHQDQGQEQGDASNGNSGISAPEVTPTPVPGYSGINAPAVTPSQVPQYSGSGIGGPQVIATGVPMYNRFLEIVTNPVVTNTLAVIGGLAVAKEVHDQTDGNGDKPVSK